MQTLYEYVFISVHLPSPPTHTHTSSHIPTQAYSHTTPSPSPPSQSPPPLTLTLFSHSHFPHSHILPSQSLTSTHSLHTLTPSHSNPSPLISRWQDALLLLSTPLYSPTPLTPPHPHPPHTLTFNSRSWYDCLLLLSGLLLLLFLRVLEHLYHGGPQHTQ